MKKKTKSGMVAANIRKYKAELLNLEAQEGASACLDYPPRRPSDELGSGHIGSLTSGV